MEGCGVSKMKSWLLLLIVMMVCGIEGKGGCIEEERNALLQIKTSLLHSLPVPYVGPPPLMSWVDDDGECCDWERVTCNTTTGHITDLSLRNMMNGCGKTWPLNVSVFLHFKELTSLNLSWNCLGDGIVNTGLGRLSSLNKLEILDLSFNRIGNEIFPSLGALTSLRVLDLTYNHFEGYFPALALKNLEVLDLSWNFNMEGFERVSLLKKLKILNLTFCSFNESSITSLSALRRLKSLNLNYNGMQFGMPFPIEELVHFTNLEELDLRGHCSIKDCTKLSRLKRFKIC